VINTVQYSNHTGYPKGFGGEILQPETFDKIITGLRNNSLLYPISAVLQGYTPNVPLLQRVCELVKVSAKFIIFIYQMKTTNPNTKLNTHTVLGHETKQSQFPIWYNYISNLSNLIVVTPIYYHHTSYTS
jgi:pyridoxal/pyridoxine/pyridoxamine kinase